MSGVFYIEGYPLFLIYKTNIFVKLLKINLIPMLLYFFVIYFCDIWSFSSSRKHLLITFLRPHMKYLLSSYTKHTWAVYMG